MHILDSMNDKLIDNMKSVFTTPISILELDKALQEMTIEKALGLDRMIIEFFIQFWDVSKIDYLEMLKEAKRYCHFLLVITCGLIFLLLKSKIKS